MSEGTTNTRSTFMVEWWVLDDSRSGDNTRWVRGKEA